MSSELHYVGLLFALFVVPKALQRFRVPAAITSLALGAAAARAGLFVGDPAVALLATLGITGLFLFAGLDVDLGDLRRGAGIVAQHVAIQAALVAGAVALLARLELGWRPAALVALALLTPSTGFILDSLSTFGLDDRQAFWTRTKAVATELVALGVLFVVVQSSSPLRLAASSAALLALVAVIPAALRLFASAIAPYAPRSEFAFLVMLGVLAAYATRHLGVYYLVGAFLVGIAARSFRRRLPAFSSDRLVGAVEVFASFFAPFYFFGAGAHLDPTVLGPASLLVGLGLFAVIVPVRVATVAAHRRLTLGEPFARGARVGISLAPTLVFSLVLADLAHRFGAPPWAVGGVVVYAVANTMLPGFALGVLPAFDAPHAAGVVPAEPSAAAAAQPAALPTMAPARGDGPLG